MQRLWPLIAALMVLAGLAWAPAAQAHTSHAAVMAMTTPTPTVDAVDTQATPVVATAASDCDDGCCDCAGGTRNCCGAAPAIAPAAGGKCFLPQNRLLAHPFPADTARRPDAAVSEIDQPPIFA